ncbi:TIGR02302 family protein [Pseudoruegeria sp. SK021]|uniref:TIGR02302 family protein n=1 Tax=Pseudoruegeria sp. SK021 TaxID=1933035 RepID=UPI000A24106B|nr:TIGR02302 family protein [Pseudoruegeria sp. SK021]OSP55645.1 TIGR02302 family protein [Pseudoruegeria sp. SK021]
MPDPIRRPRGTPRALQWPLRLTRLGLVAERVTQNFWKLWSLCLLCLGAVFFGLHDHLNLELLWTALVFTFAGLVWFTWSGLRRFQWPTQAEAEARLDSTLAGRPIAALADTQAIGVGDTGSEQVWQAHQNRMRQKLRDVRAPAPNLRLSRFDRYGLRYVALTIFMTALLFGSLARVETLGGIGLGPTSQAVANGPSWEGWVEPPDYTGRPDLYLNDLPRGRIELPQGSRISLRLYGPTGALTVAETVSARTGDIESASETSQTFEIRQDGRLEIRGPGGAAWDITVQEDAPPTISPAGEAEANATGEMTLPFQAADDYGVMAGQARIALDLDQVTRQFGLTVDPDPREAIQVDLPMPFSGERTDFQETLVEDFSKHPWAGLPVTVTLTASDAASREGSSGAIALERLPGRRFFDPLAAAVIEMRRDLLWSISNAPRVTQVLRAVSYHPEDLFRSETNYLRLRFLIRRLESETAAGLSVQARDEAAEAMWELALRIEDGDLADAMERLRRAQDRLSEAMKNGASDTEIAQLMQELRDAMQDYMRQLAEQGEGQEQQQADNQNTQEITGQQLQELLDQIQRLMEEGRMAEAQALLDMLAQMMQNMQVTQGQQGGQGGSGQQSMQGLAETLRDQQSLSDDSFQGLQGLEPGQGEGEGQTDGENQGQDQPGSPSPSLGQSLAERQRTLGDSLDQQRNALPGGQGGQAARDALDEAGRAMDRAEEALRRNDLAGAMDSQSEAMDGIREGMKELGEELARQQGQSPGQGGQAGTGTSPSGSRDPLGRSTGSEGQFGTQDSILQDPDAYERARDLLDEIRRRSGEQERPDIELDYLRRLLDRF